MRTLLIIAFFISQIFAVAQNFEATVSKTTVAVGERFTLEFKTELGGASFTPPTMENIRVLSGPNMSESSMNINGKRSRSFTVSYVLQAQKEGIARIGQAGLKTRSESFNSDPITLTVTKASAKQAAQENDVSTTLFIKLFVDKKNPYVGEQIVATYKIYMAEQVVNYSANSPVYNGFYAQNIDLDNANEVSQEFINGKQFTVATLKRVILTPQKIGNLTVDALEMEMRIRVADQSRGRGFFGFQSYKDVAVEVQSNEEKINVKALPTANQPAGFDGAVGQFKLQTSVDRTNLKANEAVTLTINVEGNGNIELLPEPKIKFPKDFEVYDPKVKKNIAYTAAGASGKKSFEYVIIPRFAGEFNLEPIRLSYFDTRSNAYKTLTSDPITLNVEKGNGSGSDAIVYNPANKEDVQIIGKDIRYIKTEKPTLTRKESGFFRSLNFYFIALFMLFLTAGACFGIYFLRKQGSDGAFKSKKAGGVAKKHLAKASKLIDGENEAFYEAISKALFGYLSDKLSINIAELNRENIESELKARALNQELLTALTKALDECDMVRFAPGIVRGKTEMLSASKEIIERLENEI